MGVRVSKRARALVLTIAATASVALGAASTAVSAAPAGAASGNNLNVVAGEYVYQLKGSPKPGWVTITFENKGTEMHMLALAAFKPGTTVADLKEAASAQDDTKYNSIVDTSIGVDGQIPGVPTLLSSKNKTVATVNLPAGHYGILCFVPAADGTPHALHGMIKMFDVKGAKSSAKPPTTQVTADLTDSGITFPVDNPGRNLSVKVTNSGTALHSFALIRVNDGQTLDGVRDYFNAFFAGQAPAGDAPGELVGGIAAIAPGGTAYFQQTLKPGHYGYVSTEGDDPATDDYSKGLKGEFDVK
ncbi:MAG: hypothetical protein U0W40_01525 [Acidimicrobiia bacterium]